MIGRWLSRLSFTCFILAMALVYTVMRAKSEGTPLDIWDVRLRYAGAIILMVMGTIGVRERHRRG